MKSSRIFAVKAPEERRAGGLGIHLVRQLCRQFRYDWSDGVGETLVVIGVNE